MAKKQGNILVIIGLLLLAAALFWTGANLIMDRQAGAASRSTLEKLLDTMPAPAPAPTLPGVAQDNQPEAPSTSPSASASAETEIPDFILNPEMDMPVRNIDGVDYIGVLTIPAIDLQLPVVSSWSYEYLRLAPCRFVGSAYTDDLIIAGHNYTTTHFSSLPSLQPGDVLSFTDVDGNVFTYRVVETETLGENAIEEMTGSGYALTLFTCTVGGQFRVTVRCERLV